MLEKNGKKLTGRIAADRIRMTSTPKPPPGAANRFIALGECTSLISDVMDELGIPEGVIGASTLKPTLPGKLICGPALTVRNITQRSNPSWRRRRTPIAWPSSRRTTLRKTATCW